MGKTINLVRPNGEVVTVTEEQAAKLLPLGYREEETGERILHNQDVAEEEHYTSGSERLKALGEGALSGLTIGLSDYVLDSEGADKRAQYNPGTRIAGEIAGGLAPAILTGGGTAATSGGSLARLARYTPAGRLAEVGGNISRGVGGLKGAVAGATFEGAVVGGGAEISRAALADDNITVEGVLASAGLGGAFGAGAGVLSHGLEKLGTRAQQNIAEGEQRAADLLARSKLTPEDARLAVRQQYLPDDAFDSLRASITSFEKTADDAIRQAEETVAAMDKAAKRAARDEDALLAAQFDEAFSRVKPGAEPTKAPSVKQTWKFLKSAGDEVFNSSPEALGKQFAGNRSSIQKAYGRVEKAVRAGDDVAAREAMNEYREAVRRFQSKLGGAAEQIELPNVITPRAADDGLVDVGQAAQDIPDPRQGDIFDNITNERTSASVKAAQTTIDMKVVRDAITKFPRTAEEFLKLSKGKAEQMFGALDKALATGGPELDIVRKTITDEIDKLVTRAGVLVDGSPVERLRAVYTTWRSDAVQSQVSALKGEARDAKQALRGGRDEGGGNPLGILGRTLRQASSRGASSAARRAGGGAFLSSAAYQGAGFMVGSALTGGGAEGGVMGMIGAAAMGARARVMAQVQQAVAKWTPRAARGVRTAGPRIEPLIYGASGIEDDPSIERRELFKKRSSELRELAATGKDRAYALATQFRAEGHDAFAAALHAKMVSALDKALGAMPKDPGKTPWGFDSLWEPTPIQLETYARVHRAIFNPLGSFEAFANGDVHPVEVEAVRDAYPGLYTEWKVQMIEKLSEPGVMKKLSRTDLSELSVALDMQLSPTQRPEFIAAQQQMFAERTPQSSPNPAGPTGRPGGSGEQATAAQRAEQR